MGVRFGKELYGNLGPRAKGPWAQGRGLACVAYLWAPYKALPTGRMSKGARAGLPKALEKYSQPYPKPTLVCW